uniref:hypothetical protein n=1 Tax=Saccharolobus islandicus TaxID=43080 RepID=UPI00159EC88F|nr:hypothetical protein [Sulfolobus islandicus]
MVVKKIEDKESKESETFNLTLEELLLLDNQISFQLLRNKQLSQKIEERDIFDIIERVLTLQKQLQPEKKESADIAWLIELLKLATNPDFQKALGELINKFAGGAGNK